MSTASRSLILYKKILYKFRFNDKGLYDVSDELAEVEVCSVDNLDGCKTYEACMPLPKGYSSGYYWSYYRSECVYKEWE